MIFSNKLDGFDAIDDDGTGHFIWSDCLRKIGSDVMDRDLIKATSEGRLLLWMGISTSV